MYLLFIFFMFLNITDKYPQDEVALSYWCGKNVLIDAKDRLRLFRTNSITERMLIIGKSLDYVINYIYVLNIHV